MTKYFTGDVGKDPVRCELRKSWSQQNTDIILFTFPYALEPHDDDI